MVRQKRERFSVFSSLASSACISPLSACPHVFFVTQPNMMRERRRRRLREDE
jgi:hypothetical protein